jgi:hypothetical protein
LSSKVKRRRNLGNKIRRCRHFFPGECNTLLPSFQSQAVFNLSSGGNKRITNTTTTTITTTTAAAAKSKKMNLAADSAPELQKDGRLLKNNLGKVV